MSVGFDAASEAARRAVIENVADKLAEYETQSGLRVPFRTNLVTAIR